MSKKVITIAREYGSGGRLIAQKVAEKLGIVYYDNEVIDLAAKELGFDIDTIRKAAEEKSSKIRGNICFIRDIMDSSQSGHNSLPWVSERDIRNSLREQSS